MCACVCVRQVSPTDFGAFDSAFVALFRISAGDAWIESLPQVCVCVCVCVYARTHTHACVRACVRARVSARVGVPAAAPDWAPPAACTQAHRAA